MSDESIAFNALQLETPKNPSFIAILPKELQFDLDVSNAITITEKCIKLLRGSSKKIPGEL